MYSCVEDLNANRGFFRFVQAILEKVESVGTFEVVEILEVVELF